MQLLKLVLDKAARLHGSSRCTSPGTARRLSKADKRAAPVTAPARAIRIASTERSAPLHRLPEPLPYSALLRYFYGGKANTYRTDGFWDKALQEPDRLQLPADERQRIDLELLERVPR